MKAVVFDRIGSPLDVLYLADIPVPRIEADEVLIKMLAAPISPGDFLFIENLYPEPKKPRFPRQVGGNHGMGVVEQAGSNTSIKSGTLVSFSYYNSWAEYAAVPAEWLIPLPCGFPVEKGSQFFNLVTAWDLLAQSRVKAGQWLALTAGYSAISTMVLQFARQKNVNVISLVRRAHDSRDLRQLGAHDVIVTSGLSDESIRARIMEITANRGIGALIDSVGGPHTGELIRCMDFGAHVIINGGMSAERFQLHNFDVLLRGIGISAHVYRYFFTPPRPDDTQLLEEIADAVSRPDFKVFVGGWHALQDFKAAIAETIRNPGAGKRFFGPS